MATKNMEICLIPLVIRKMLKKKKHHNKILLYTLWDI